MVHDSLFQTFMQGLTVTSDMLNALLGAFVVWALLLNKHPFMRWAAAFAVAIVLVTPQTINHLGVAVA